MSKLSIRDVDLANKHVFIRVDFNVPLSEDGSTITDDTRIVATLPTIEYALQHRAKVILASHLGRPKGKPNPKYSLRPVVDRLRELLDKKVGDGVNVAFSPDCVGEVAERTGAATRVGPGAAAGEPALPRRGRNQRSGIFQGAWRRWPRFTSMTPSARRIAPTRRRRASRIISSPPSQAC